MLDKKKYLSEHEVRQLREYVEAMALRDQQRGRTYWPRRWAVIDFLLSTGTRASEARKVKIKDLSLGHEPSIFIANGKGGKTRTIPISSKLKKHLKEYLEWKTQLNENTEGDAYLFVNRLGRRYSLSGIQSLFKACRNRSGLRHCYTIHSTRHSYGFLVYGKSKNLRLTQHLLGHSRVSTTQIYAHVDPAELVETVENLW